MVTRKNALWMLCLAGGMGSLTAMADQEEQKNEGFIEGSSLSVIARNLYWQDDRHKGVRDNKEWGQSFMAFFESGFTQGTVGFGIDAHAFQGIKLDGGAGTAGSSILPYADPHNSNLDYGSAPRGFSRAGASAKVRLFDTVIKYGDQLLDNPLIGGDERLMPQTFRALSVVNNSFDGIELSAGRAFLSHPYNQSGHRRFFTSYGELPADEAGENLSWAGVTYQPLETLSTSFYAGKLKDIWAQYYADIEYTYEINDDLSLLGGLNYYKTKDSGDAMLGDINNNTYSLSLGAAYKQHTMTLVYQRVNGNTPFDYIDGGSSIYLGNSQQYSDFSGPNERSWKIQYEYDMADLLPGMTFLLSYSRGKLDLTKVNPNSLGYAGWYNDAGKDAKHWERDVALGYTVQSGPLKDLLVSFAWAAHRTTGGYSAVDDSVDEYQFTVEYPYDFF